MECSARALAASSIKGARGTTIADAEEVFFPAPMVLARYHISDMTLHRWLRDERKRFPRPYYFGRFRYFKVSELAAWERERARAQAA